MREKTYYFHMNGKEFSIKGKTYEDAVKKAGEKYGYYSVKEFTDNTRKSPEIPSLNYRDKVVKSPNKEECKMNDGEWIKGYTRRVHGKKVTVKGYCREKHTFSYQPY